MDEIWSQVTANIKQMRRSCREIISQLRGAFEETEAMFQRAEGRNQDLAMQVCELENMLCACVCACTCVCVCVYNEWVSG